MQGGIISILEERKLRVIPPGYLLSGPSIILGWVRGETGGELENIPAELAGF